MKGQDTWQNARTDQRDLSEGSPELRNIDVDTLLEMYDEARANEDDQCDAISAELIWRGIEVQPCGHAHGVA